MKIAIVNPLLSEGWDGQPHFYMSVLYLATALENAGHDVTVIDAQIDDAPSELEKIIGTADCVGFTVLTSQIKHALELSDFIKNINPKIPVVWGGVHPTLYPSQTIKDKAVDFVVRGEGENTFLELLEHLRGERPPKEIDGLVYVEDGEVKINRDREYDDLNKFSPPAWHKMNVKKYIRHWILGKTDYGSYMSVHSGRGCPEQCSFCINTVLCKRKWRPLSAEKMFKEVKMLKENYGIDFIKFVDENFFINKHRAKEFCNLMVKSGLDMGWQACGKANYFNENHISEDLIKLIKDSGCKVISMGIESGSQRILDKIKKNIKVEDAVTAVKKCEEIGIRPLVSFMVGMPGEEREDIKKTFALVKRLREVSPNILVAGPQPYRPYPGSSMYDEIKSMINEPKTLREWADSELLSGYMPMEKLPWIKDPKYISNLWFYTSRSGASSPDFLGRFFGSIFKKIALFRLEHDAFFFPLDKTIYEYGRRTYYKIRGKHSNN